jgi:hypothetical protein
MKIKANGITINYQLDGPERAPWLILSNSLATNLTMWDEQATSGSARQGDRLRFAVPIDAGEQPAMGGAYRDRAKAGDGGVG